MKKIARMIIFSAVALYATSLWNKGFTITGDPLTFLKASLLVAVIYYLITPLTKLILLPLNIVTLGLVSVLAYFLIFYFIVSRFPFAVIKDWVFPGAVFFGITVAKTDVGYLGNVILSSLSISFIINFLEMII